MSILRRGVWLAIFVAALVGGWKFAGNNATTIGVDYLFGEIAAVPVWVALIVSFAAGAGVMGLALFARLTRSSLAQRRYRRTLASLETEVHQLRNLPLEEGRELPAVESGRPAPVAGADDPAAEASLPLVEAGASAEGRR